jgi:hypothetical protein
MGQKDTATIKFIKQNHIFADAFNFFLYGGEQIIDPASLKEMDTREIVIPYGHGKGTKRHVLRQRDVIKSAAVMTDNENAYLIMAVENQSQINYAMPVRNCLYDAMEYTRQVEELIAKHRQADGYQGVNPDEFLSGFRKTDKLIPVLTLVIYFGASPWDGPMSVHDMFTSRNERVRAFIPDYKLNLIAPAFIRDEDFDRFHSTLKEVLSFIKYSMDKAKLQELVEKDEVFRHMSREEYEVINTCTNSNLKADEAEEEVNMCQAIREMMEEAEAKGRAEAEVTVKEAEAKAKEIENKAKEVENKVKEVEANAKVEKMNILLKSVKAFMEKTGMSLEQVVSLLDISKSDQELLMPLL